MRPNRRSPMLAGLFVIATARVSHAQADVPAPAAPVALADSLTGSAKQAFDAATSLASSQNFAGALAKFSQAYDLSKDPRLLYNMAICEKNLGHYTRMRSLLERYENEAGAALDPTTRANVERALHAVVLFLGSVAVRVSETGAELSLDGVSVGQAPLLAPLVVDPGRHVLLVRKGGFETAERELDVAGGARVSIDVRLQKAAVARLAVTAERGASITIDGVLAGSDRFEGSVAPGTHAVLVTEPEKRPYAATLEIRDGETRTLTVTLEPKQGRSMWPWIVGAAAVAAAGAAVGGYFVLKPSNGGTTAPPPAGQLGSLTFSSLRRPGSP